MALLPWVAVAKHGREALAHIPKMEALPTEGDELGRLSVVIAARDEADQVETALRSLAAQSHPNYEIIIVNDRSTDTTGEIIDKMANEFPDKIRAEHIQELPEGWLGKCNAMQVGAEAAEGDYILFTDGDVEFEPTVLERTHRYAVQENADQVAVFPDTIAGSAGEESMLTAFTICFMLWFQPQRVTVKHSGKYVGIGAFNMIRTEMYRKIGGHRFLRLQVVDDVGLGKLVKYSGGVVRMAWGTGYVKVRWQVSLAATIKGLEKNFFAWANYSVLRGIVSVVGVWIMFIWPLIGLFVGSWPEQLLAGAVLLVEIAVAAASARRGGFNPIHGLTAPFGGFCLSLAMLRSMWKTKTQRGIVWRDHFYPLKELKQFKL